MKTPNTKTHQIRSFARRLGYDTFKVYLDGRPVDPEEVAKLPRGTTVAIAHPDPTFFRRHKLTLK